MKLIILTTTFLSFVFILSGQEINEPDWDELLNSPVIRVDNPAINNLTSINQFQDNNDVYVHQEQLGSQFNAAVIGQNGIQNRGSVHQEGSDLISQLEQNQSYNDANIISKGENIHVRARQNGNYNKINSYIENDGSSRRSADLLQAGDGNHINLDLRGDGFGSSTEEQWVKITQQGNGHEAIAIKNPFSASFEIEQMPGAGGAGMKVEVSTSDFYFPMK